jgi:hypothetical protein
MNTNKSPKPLGKLSRAQVTQALDSVPVSHILGKSAARELTAKQKAFALEVAKGSTGASAYRRVYSSKAKPKTSGDAASRLKGDSRIAAEIEAYELALKGETYRTPAALRALVVQTLAQVLVDPDAKQAVKVQAAKAIGAMTDVSLFTHRTETRVIKSSDDARAELMAQIREITNSQAIDVTAIDADADSLLAELEAGALGDDVDSGGSVTHRTPTPQDASEESLAYIHTIPHERSPISPNVDTTPTAQDDPPSSFGK